jgi:geranylgeranyl diphosphate synthase type II
MAVKELADAIGTAGMIGGQTADVEAEGRQVTREDVIEIHRRKTAALIRCSVRLGAMIAGADSELLSRLSNYGENIGLAFQIIDDILDIEGNQDLLGKHVGSDNRKQKATYPSTVGIKQAQHDATVLIEKAISHTGNSNDNMLAQIARYIGQRTN